MPGARRVIQAYLTAPVILFTVAVLCLATAPSARAQVDTVDWIISVRWTAPGDDGMVGTASAYDVRYSLNPITAGNWNSATQATGEHAPSPAFSTDSFTIMGLLPDTPYYVAVKARDEASNWSVLSNVITKRSTINLGTGVDDGSGAMLPVSTELGYNYPNPFNPSTSIDFSLPRTMRVRLAIINELGQRIATLMNGAVLSAGPHTVVWNGRSDAGAQVASGVYFYQLVAEDRTISRAMTMLK
jgi:hypothetical protein